MVRTRRIGPLGVAVMALSFVACNDSEQQSPIAPTPVAGVAETGQTVVELGEAAAVEEGTSVSEATARVNYLKVGVPTIQAPIGNVELPSLSVTLNVSNVVPNYSVVLEGGWVPPKYRFELYVVGADEVTQTEVSLSVPVVEQGQEVTTLVVPVDLEEGTSYKWRARAEKEGPEGVNLSSAWSEYGSFRTPILASISAPIPSAPANGATGIQAPIILEVTNGEATGSVGVVIITFEIATDSGFSTIVNTVTQTAGQHNFTGTGKEASDDPARALKTSQQPSIPLEDSTVYHWRVKAHSQERPEVSSGYSAPSSFTTADPNTGGGSSSGGGGGNDALDLSSVTWLHTNISGWAQTSTVTNVTISSSNICIRHTKAGGWPIVTVNGTPLEGNPWVIANIGGRWYAGTYEWLRPGQTCKGITASNIGPHIKRSPMTSWRPRSGETVYFGVSTGARFGGGHGDQRSNFVKMTWP